MQQDWVRGEGQGVREKETKMDNKTRVGGDDEGPTLYIQGGQ